MKVEIKKKIITDFRKFVRRSYPNECGGFLLGTELAKSYNIKDIYIPSEQEKYTTPDKIEICEQWWDEAEERAVELGVSVLGFIHSHPDCRDVSGSEQDLSLTHLFKVWLPDVKVPLMGIVGVYRPYQESKSLRTKVGIWPMFDQHKIVTK